MYTRVLWLHATRSTGAAAGGGARARPPPAVPGAAGDVAQPGAPRVDARGGLGAVRRPGAPRRAECGDRSARRGPRPHGSARRVEPAEPRVALARLRARQGPPAPRLEPRGVRSPKQPNRIEPGAPGARRTHMSTTIESDIAVPGLADRGRTRTDWAERQMPVLGRIRGRFAEERPLAGVRIAVGLHITPETAVLLRTLQS